MKKVLLLCVLILAGCAGQTARQKALRPAIQNGWQSIRAYAVDPNGMDEAVKDCGCPDLVTAWNETEVNPTGTVLGTELKQETVNLLNAAIPLYCEEL